jgi:hypothetical protein
MLRTLCAVGSWGGWCLSMAPYVTGMGPTDGTTAAGGCLKLATLYAPTFRALKAPVQRVCAAPVPVPYSRPPGQAALPDRERITAAIRRVLDHTR